MRPRPPLVHRSAPNPVLRALYVSRPEEGEVLLCQTLTAGYLVGEVSEQVHDGDRTRVRRIIGKPGERDLQARQVRVVLGHLVSTWHQGMVPEIDGHLANSDNASSWVPSQPVSVAAPTNEMRSSCFPSGSDPTSIRGVAYRSVNSPGR